MTTSTFIIFLIPGWIISVIEENKMKRVENFYGIDCPNCASAIEEELRKQEGIESVDIDLMRQKIIIHAADRQATERALNAVGASHPDLKFGTREEASSKRGESTRARGERVSEIGLLCGILLFAAAVIVRLTVTASLPPLLLSAAAYILIGVPIFAQAARNLFHGKIFDENFLMLIASIGAFAVGESAEAVAVILFYRIGEFFQDKAVERSRQSITALMDLRPDTACRVREDGETETVSPEEIEPGEIILVVPGGQIPLDGEVLSGESSLDTSSLTGESLPRTVVPGDAVLSGCINLGSVLRIRVTKRMSESTAARILELTENAASRKARTEKMITKFASVYTPLVVAAAVLTAVIPVLVWGEPFGKWLYRALIFLVISCPCALVISIPLAYFAAIGCASKRGVLLKGSRVLESLKHAQTFVFDKTGTLTEGRFRIRRLLPASGVSETALLRAAAAAESFSSHPLAFCIRESAGADSVSPALYFGVSETEIGYSETAGNGVMLKAGTRWLYAGTRRFLESCGVKVSAAEAGGTAVYVADETRFLGLVELFDGVRDEAVVTVADLRHAGVRRLFMLTGDREEAAKEIAEAVRLDGFRAGLLPEDKVGCLEELMNASAGGTTVFVGDGINDAPVLARADVGVAMGGLGSDAAIEAADAVLMSDDISQLSFAVRLAKKTGVIAVENIVFSLGVKAAVSVAAVFGFGSMWAAVFADVGVALLTVLNAMRLSVFGKNEKRLDRKAISVHTGKKS